MLVQYVGEAAVESVKVAAVQHMSTQHVSSLLSNTCAIPTHLTITARYDWVWGFEIFTSAPVGTSLCPTARL